MKDKKLISIMVLTIIFLSIIPINTNLAKNSEKTKINFENLKKYYDNSYDQLYCIIPSNAIVGQPIDITIHAWDWAERICKQNFKNYIVFSSTDKNSTLPKSTSFKIKDGGVKTLEKSIIFNTIGIHYIIIFDEINNKYSVSNPIKITEEEPEYKWYWGDIHFHSTISDGSGTAFHNTKYARDISKLDFCCLTDHDSTWGFKFQYFLYKSYGWRMAKTVVNHFYEPEKFVTLLGYEYTNKNGDGHYNVYYNTVKRAPMYSHTDEESYRVVQLWQLLKDWKNKTGFDVFTIPHHPIISWNISNFDEEMVPLIEIFQYRGSSEMLNEQGNPVPFGEKSLPNATGTAQNGLACGYKLGFIASSDDHTGHPGHRPYLRSYFTEPFCYVGPFRFIPANYYENQRFSWYLGFKSKIFYYQKIIDPQTEFKTGYPYGGLVGVYAKNLTREEIFNSLKDRRCIAVSNQNRAIVDFTVNNKTVGEGSTLYVSNIFTPRHINISIAATAPIDNISIIKNNKTIYYEKYENSYFLDLSNYQKNISIVDNEPIVGVNYNETHGTNGTDYYYVRILQKNSWAAWIGPIWVSLEQ